MKCFKCTKKVLIPVFAVIAAAIVIAAYYLFLAEKPNNYAKNVTLIINNGGDDITIESGTNAGYVSELLEQLKNEGKLTYTTENDTSFGLYVTGINGRTAQTSNNEYYAFYVKGAGEADFIYASFGIAQQALNNGDSIKLILETW